MGSYFFYNTILIRIFPVIDHFSLIMYIRIYTILQLPIRAGLIHCGLGPISNSVRKRVFVSRIIVRLGPKLGPSPHESFRSGLTGKWVGFDTQICCVDFSLSEETQVEDATLPCHFFLLVVFFLRYVPLLLYMF